MYVLRYSSLKIGSLGWRHFWSAWNGQNSNSTSCHSISPTKSGQTGIFRSRCQMSALLSFSAGNQSLYICRDQRTQSTDPSSCILYTLERNLSICSGSGSLSEICLGGVGAHISPSWSGPQVLVCAFDTYHHLRVLSLDQALS